MAPFRLLAAVGKATLLMVKHNSNHIIAQNRSYMNYTLLFCWIYKTATVTQCTSWD